jgi:peptidoglycan/LPS O-acetylase OafA/YrhL
MTDTLSTARPIAGVDAHAAKYERFIDGLRVIAVGAVILFHLFPTVRRGGLVGVDVFFVISGYLIAGQIRQQVGAGTFSVSSFYARRIRRLTPPPVFCDAAQCVAGRNGQVWYRDDGHLSNTGARAGVHVFDPVFAR